ncbi:MAG: cation diffusion facilitator family transporter [Halobacteriota archaeon]
MGETPVIHTRGHAAHVTAASILSSKRGIWALKWSFVGLILTALLQATIVYYSGSVALLADTIHNIGDALTAVPLWIAFRMSRWTPTARFTYGYGRVEDFAGIAIVLVILFSATLAGYESVSRLFHPQEVRFLGAVMVASLIGFAGNEAVAQFRISVGKEINSAALIADGHHARVDSLTSLAVFFGALGVYAGYPLADPIIGLLITVAILRVVWDAGKSVVIRMIDGIDPTIPDEIREGAAHADGVREVTEVRVRWLGHRLRAEVNIAVDPSLSVEAGHAIAKDVRHHLLHHLPYLDDAVIHVDPLTASGEEYHHIRGHDY